ncbi:hypothetical protein ACROYT_G014495 [Oculina patagonica]
MFATSVRGLRDRFDALHKAILALSEKQNSNEKNLMETASNVSGKKVSRPLNLVVSHSPISTGATPVPAITVQKTPKKELEAGEKEDQSSSKQINTDSQSHIQAASGSTESSGYGACLPTESATNSSIIVDDDMNGACSSSKRRITLQRVMPQNKVVFSDDDKNTLDFPVLVSPARQSLYASYFKTFQMDGSSQGKFV